MKPDMKLDRRAFTGSLFLGSLFLGSLAALSLRQPAWAAGDDRGLFWKVARNGQPPTVLFGYERTAAAITADVVRDGDRFVDGAQRIVGAMPNFTLPQIDITKTGQPTLAQRVGDFVAASPALRVTPVDKISGIAFVTFVMLEGQTNSPVTVGGTIAEHAQAASKPISYLLSMDDIKSIYRPPDVGAIDKQIDNDVVNYLFTLRDAVGPVGKYFETLYVACRSQDIERVSDEMKARGVPSMEAVGGMPPDLLQPMLETRARDLLSQQASGDTFLMLPLGIFTGDGNLLAMLRQAGMEVSTVA